MRRSFESFLPRGAITQDHRDDDVLYAHGAPSDQQTNTGRGQPKSLRAEAQDRRETNQIVPQRVLRHNISEGWLIPSEGQLYYWAQDNHSRYHDDLWDRDDLQDVQARTASQSVKAKRMAWTTEQRTRRQEGQCTVLVDCWSVWPVLCRIEWVWWA